MQLGLGLYLGTILGRSGPFAGASLYLDFMSGALDSRITFARTSTATFVGSDGLIQSAAINTPRFDYDPVTLAPRGLLIEEQRTNLVTYSEQFDNASWVKTSVTVTANSAASPAGTTTADTLAATGANGTVTQAISTTAIAMTYSVYLKRKTGTGNIQITAGGSTWVTQTIDSTNWTRCIVTQTALAGTTSPGIRIVSSGDEVFAWGAQYE
jgi:hypothetical protein